MTPFRHLLFAGLPLMASMTAEAQSAPPPNPVARGTFSVEMKPQGDAADAAAVKLGRMSLDKRFDGDLSGTGSGTMLTAMTPTQGSAGYVAIERVSGRLHGREGSFVLQHTGIMDRGTPSLSITVVPDSGTGALAGIRGVFRLRVEGGQHHYELEYTLPR